MSRISDLGAGYKNLPNVLEEYETLIDDAKDILEIKGKLLERANMENPSWQVFYDQKKAELNTLLKFMEMETNRVRGKLYKSYKENHQRELTDREINKYIDNEKAFTDVYQLSLEVNEIYDKLKGIVDGFTTRGYALNNITKIRVASLEDAEL